MKLELDLQIPYTSTGSPRTDLPTGEVLAWDGKRWSAGVMKIRLGRVYLCDVETGAYVYFLNVQRFAPLPTIIEQDGNEIL